MSLDGPSVLIADDEPEIRDVTARFLSSLGYRVTAASDGQAVLDLLDQGEHFDAFLLDQHMPAVSGEELLVELRRRPDTWRAAVIVVSALSEPGDIVRAFSLGADDFVAKPFDFSVLVARLTVRLNTRRGGVDDSDVAPARLADVREGALLGGRYRLEAQIGEGAVGSVYRARHVGLDTPCAVKVLRLQGGNDADALARFKEEGVKACRIQHPNAVRVFDVDETAAGIAYLVMELLEGRTLEDEIAEHGTLSPARCVEVMMPVSYVLAAAHAQGIVHRDIKPANIFLHRSPRGEVVKVLDFGIAKVVGAHRDPTRETGDRLLGSPAYMAPERFARAGYDGKADVYSVGICLYEMLTGRTPFASDDRNSVQVAVAHLQDEPEPLRAAAPACPTAVAEVIQSCLAKSPAARPTIQHLAIQLADAAVESGAYQTSLARS